MNCTQCREEIVEGRAELGFVTCNDCGEIEARRRKHTVVPMHKSNYILVTDRTLLRQLNKRAV
jgi:ribosomal protein L37AE/L43A